MKHWSRSFSKYNNRKVGRYASKKEALRAGELKLLEKAGEITQLQEQVRYELIPKQEGERAVTYVADFAYHLGRYPYTLVVEDVKGFKTPEYIIKRKLLLKVFGIKIREI